MTTPHPLGQDALTVFECVVVGMRAGEAPDLRDEAGRDAVALAKELGSRGTELLLLHVHLVTSKPTSGSGEAADATACRQAVDRLKVLGRECSVDATVACVEAQSVREGLHRVAATRHADLLVVGANRDDDLGREFVGDDARAVLEDAPCSVAVAPAGLASRPHALQKVGVAYDGSPESEQAVAVARSLAAEHGAKLSAFEAVPAPVYASDPWNVEGEVGEHLEMARRRLTALGDVEPEAGYGDAVEELAKYSRRVDLLVLGSHRYRATEHLVERSTSQRLADESSSPLLVLASAARPGE